MESDPKVRLSVTNLAYEITFYYYYFTTSPEFVIGSRTDNLRASYFN